MPRKKRRGRPPGSKNKAKFTGSATNMDVAQLSSYIATLQKTLAAKVEEQRAYFERQLAGLGGYTNTNGRRSAGSTAARVAKPRAGRRAKRRGVSTSAHHQSPSAEPALRLLQWRSEASIDPCA